MLKDEVFEKLKCLLIDENKIVTYKTLSKQLNIHTNEAKLYLSKFFNAYHDENGLNAYYAIIGTQEADDHIKHYKTAIVSAKNLENVKSRFSTLSSIQIYCIYKGNLVDKCSLYTADYEPSSEDVSKRLSAISNHSVKILPKLTIAPETRKVEINVKQPSLTNAQNSGKSEESTKKNRSPDILSLFQKKEGKKNTSAKTEISSDGANSNAIENSKSVKNEKNGEKASVKQLFSKQLERNASKPLVKVDKSDSEKPLVVQPSKASVEKGVPLRKQSKKKSRQKDDSDSEEQQKAKKHRRIMTMDDTDSESESEEAKDKTLRNMFSVEKELQKCEVEDDEDHLIPPTPPTTTATAMAPTSKKKWKVVTKTFQDEDGFFVTKKTKEYVSSEESEEEPMQAPKPPPKVPVNKNKKQSSLTSFFRQK